MNTLSVPTSMAEKEVMATLKAMTVADSNNDVSALSKIYHEDLSYNHASGRIQTKAEVLNDITTRTWRRVSMEFSDVTICIDGALAVVKTTTDLAADQEGKVKHDHHNQVWVLVKGPRSWEILLRHSAKIAKK